MLCLRDAHSFGKNRACTKMLYKNPLKKCIEMKFSIKGSDLMNPFEINRPSGSRENSEKHAHLSSNSRREINFIYFSSKLHLRREIFNYHHHGPCEIDVDVRS